MDVRLTNAVASMSDEQRWALRVAIMTERRLRTHYQPAAGQGAIAAAQEWALAQADRFPQLRPFVAAA